MHVGPVVDPRPCRRPGRGTIRPVTAQAIDGAVAWAGAVLEAPVTKHAVLVGGMTSTMLRLTDATGARSVLRLMTEEPWRSHGADLTRRERQAQRELVGTGVPAPLSLGLDAEGGSCGVAAHLMTELPGAPEPYVDEVMIGAMADLLVRIHNVRPAEPFRAYQSWAWPAKWVVPAWARRPEVWREAFALLAGPAPDHRPTFLHRDFSHRNLLWDGAEITGVVDWVETSAGPAWLDAAHAATNLAIRQGLPAAQSFVAAYAAVSDSEPEPFWLVMDTVGFLPPPGRRQMFGEPAQCEALEEWLAVAVDGCLRTPPGAGSRTSGPRRRGRTAR